MKSPTLLEIDAAIDRLKELLRQPFTEEEAPLSDRILEANDEIKTALPSSELVLETPEQKTKRLKKATRDLEQAINAFDLLGVTVALDLGADVNHSSPKSNLRAIDVFAQKGDSKAVIQLIQKGALVDGYVENHSLMYHAIVYQNIEMAQALVRAGIPVTQSVLQKENIPPSSLMLNGYRSSLSFLLTWCETFGFENTFRVKVRQLNVRSSRAAGISRAFSLIVQQSMGTPEQQQDATNLCQWMIKELGGEVPLSREKMLEIENKINEGVEWSDKFSFSSLSPQAIQGDNINQLIFLLDQGFVHNFRAISTYRMKANSEKELKEISFLWWALTNQSKKCFNALVQMPEVRQQAKEDLERFPDDIFKLIHDIPLVSWEWFDKMGFDFRVKGKTGNTLFHVIAQHGKLLKGHLNYANLKHCDELFSHKNAQGCTPFEMQVENTFAARKQNLSALSRYFEEKLLPLVMRRLVRSGVPVVPTPSRKRM